MARSTASGHPATYLTARCAHWRGSHAHGTCGSVGRGDDLLHYALDKSDPSSAGNKCGGRVPAKLCMSRAKFDSLHGFAEAAGAALVFGLAMPNTGSTWNSTEARALMMYAIRSNRTVL